MQANIERAVTIIRESSELDDEQLYHALTVAGFERRLAARLLEFLPAAYCRVLLEPSGVRFPDTFQRYCIDGAISPPMPLAAEPIWEAAIEYAQREVKQGISLQQKLQVAGRSAQFHAANELLEKGSKLENLAFTPAILPWPEEGPDAKFTPSARPKPWWNIW